MSCKSTVLLLLILSFCLATSVSDISNADSDGESFNLKMTDANGNDLSNPLFGDVTIYFDTFNYQNGTIYKLKAMMTIKTIPANITITATGGEFRLSVSATGTGSFLEETGMSLTITNGENSYVADLKKSNNYSDDFRDSSNVAKIEPNTNYIVSANLIDGYESTIAPEDVKDIKITFQAVAAEGYHEVVFVSQDKTVESYMVFDNQIIEKVPSVTRKGYSFIGWFTPNGKEISDGYIVSPSDGDIIAFAEWEKNESENNTMTYVAIGGIGGVAALLLLLLLLKRRKDEESPQ